ncbi:hypothetical protein ACQB6R_01315 [Propionibacteriaceae bacterium G1746]
MIIWAGWGMLAVLMPLLGAGLMVGLASTLQVQDPYFTAFVGVGLLLGGVATWFVGKYFNKQRPLTEARTHMAGRRQQVEALVQQGRFQLAPGYPMPSSYQEAQAQAGHLLATEEAQLEQRLRNRHTLFWVPMQYTAFLWLALGVLLLGVTVYQAATGA